MKKTFSIFVTIILCLAFLTPLSAKNEQPKNKQPVFTSESINQLNYEMGINSPYAGQFLTYTVDEDNNIIRIDTNMQQERAGSLIAVWVGGVIVGYLVSTVVDGIIIAATGQSGGWWVAQAIAQVLKTRYTGKTTINCSIYPPNLYEGYQCRMAG